MASKDHEYIVTYEVKVRQSFPPESYGHLDGDLTPQLMAEADVEAFMNGEMMMEEFFMSTDNEMKVEVKNIEAAQ